MLPETSDQLQNQVIKWDISAPEGWKNVSSVEFNKDTLGKAGFENLLRAIHSGLYSTTFPLPEEQENVDAWIARPKEDGRNPQQFINAHFKDSDDVPGSGLENAIKLANEIAECKKSGNKEDLKDLQKQFDALTVGFIVGEHYANHEKQEGQNQSAALFNYVIRNKDFSGGEYPAQAMIDQQVQQYQAAAKAAGNKLTFIGWEANDPRKTPFFNERGEPNFTVDVMDPERRIEILEKVYGAKKTNFQWIQPPLEGDKAICDALYLYSYPIKDHDGTINDKNPTEEEKINGLKHFVNQFYENFPVKDKFKSETNKQGEVKSAAEKFAEFYKEGAQKIKIPRVQENFASKTTISFKTWGGPTKGLPIADLIEEKLLPLARETFLKLKTIDSQTDSTVRTKLTSTLRNGGISDIREIDSILNKTLSQFKTELQETSEKVQNMVKDLGMLHSQESQPKKDVQSFYEEKPRCNKAAVEDGKKKLAAYEKRAKEPTAKATKPDDGKQSWVERLSRGTTQQTEQGRVH